MSKFKLAFVVGSLRKESHNKQLANALVKLFPKEFEIEFLDIGNLPLFNQDEESKPTAEVIKFKDRIRQSQGVVFITPEYNRSMSGVLKNALDVASRPYGDNAWAGKPAAVGGISIGAMGSSMAQQHLRNSLVFLDMPTLAQPELFMQYKDGLFDAEHNVTDESTKKFLQSWVDKSVAWFKKMS